MASLHKKDNGAWSIRWRCPVRRRNCQYTPEDQRKTWVERLKRDIERTCDEGIVWVPPSKRASEQPDLEILIADIIRDRGRKLKPRSLDMLRMVMGQFADAVRWRHGLADEEPLTPLQLTRQALADFWDHQVHQRGVKPRVAAKRIPMVLDVWRRLHEHDIHGPLIPIPRRLEDLPDVTSPRLPSPTWAEMDAAIQHAWGWYAHLLLVQRFTGLRVGQVMRLTREDIDLRRATLRVRGELGKSREERRGRTVPISAHLVEELATWGTWTGPLLVMTRRPKGEAPELAGKPRTAGRPKCEALQLAWERAGVRREVWAGSEEHRGQPSHAMRHGFITGLRKLGVDLELVQFLVGHTSGTVTTEVYTDFDLMEDELRAAVGRIPPLIPVDEVKLRQGGGRGSSRGPGSRSVRAPLRANQRRS